MQPIYHERQRLWLCALHAHNNLLQADAASKEHFEALARQVADQYAIPRSQLSGRFFGGDYDFLVLEQAFKERGLKMTRLEAYAPCSTRKGFIVNRESKSTMAWLGEKLGIGSKNHWFAIGLVDDVYYDLDSELKAPARIPQVKQHIDQLLAQNCVVF